MKRWLAYGFNLACLGILTGILAAAGGRGGGWHGYALGIASAGLWAVFGGVELLYFFLRREKTEFTRLQKHYQQAVAAMEQEKTVLVSVAMEATRWQDDYLNFIYQWRHLLDQNADELRRHPDLALHYMRRIVRDAEAGLKK